MANLGIGQKAIPFSLVGVDDHRHALDEQPRKNAIVLIFSCNHCPYVRAWEDRMVQIQADYAQRGVQLIAINANDDSKYPDDSFPRMKERAREKNFNFLYLRDETQETARAYGAERTPEVFLFDKELTLRYHGSIDDNYDDPAAVKNRYLRNALDMVLAGKEPPIAETQPIGCTMKWR
jgi:peroxiredoxin